MRAPISQGTRSDAASATVRAEGTFRLEKWYFDVADETRGAHIAYWARLSWLGLTVSWQSVASYAPGVAPRRRHSLAARSGPHREGSGIAWNATAIGARLAVQPSVSGFDERLSEGVDWECVAPSAHVRLEVGGEVSRGVGYTERIVLSVAPWKLPIRELRWGRWCSLDGNRSLVWIEWRHDARRCWVYLDGAPVAAAVRDNEVTSGRLRLTLDDSYVLEQRSFAEVARQIPGLLRLLPASMRDMKEEKWLSRGLLHESSSPPTPGVSIHEVVTFG